MLCINDQLDIPLNEPGCAAAGYTIRRAGKDDVSSMRKLNLQTLEQNYPKRFWAQNVCQSPNFVAFEGTSRQLAGYIGSMPYREFGVDTLMIYSISVNPKHRRRGVATMLLQALQDATPNMKLTLHTPVENVGARTLYKKMGFQEGEVVTNYYHPGDGIQMHYAPRVPEAR